MITNCNTKNNAIMENTETTDRKPLLSVIVPVYNVKDYVERCVDSIINQTYRNLEILIVDDGSTDGSGALCDVLAGRDGRIRVFHTANGGLSAARNVGIDAASGALIGFVDSDDWIEPDMYEFLYGLMMEYGADISVCGNYFDSSGRSVVQRVTQKPLILGHKEAMDLLGEDKLMKNYAWDKLYRRELFDGGLRFPVGVYFEDIAVMYKIMDRAAKVVMFGQPKYHYIYRPAGISRQLYNEKKEHDSFVAEHEKLLFMMEHGYYPGARKRLIKRSVHSMNHLMMTDGTERSVNDIIERIRPFDNVGVGTIGLGLYLRRYLMTHHTELYRKCYRSFRKLFKHRRK